MAAVDACSRPTNAHWHSNSRSFNYHEDHFGSKFDIKTSAGEVAHTACLGFGFERITLALFKTHGLRVANWPEPVRKVLGYVG